MYIKASPIEQTNAVNAIGFDFIPVKQSNGLYKMQCWKDDKLIGLGKVEYKDWQFGIRETYKNFYLKYILKL